MAREAAICLLVYAIQHKIYEIESGEKGRRKVDVLRNREIGVVF
jgi:hypothetical protein